MRKEIAPLPVWEGAGPSDRSADPSGNRQAREAMDALAKRRREAEDQAARAPEVPPLDGQHLIGSPRL